MRKFIYGPGIDEPICMIDVADSNAVYYYHFDGLGSVVALSDVNSTIVETYSYDVFGQPDSTSDVNNPYLFTGRRYDGETGLYYYRARYYDYYAGRFIQPDPLRYHDGLNLYTYVGNNPTNWMDPYGLKINWSLVIEGVGKSAGGTVVAIGGFCVGTAGASATATGVGAAPGFAGMAAGTALMIGGGTSVILGVMDIFVGFSGGDIPSDFPDSYAEMLIAPFGRTPQEVAGGVEGVASGLATGGLSSGLGKTSLAVGAISSGISIAETDPFKDKTKCSKGSSD